MSQAPDTPVVVGPSLTGPNWLESNAYWILALAVIAYMIIDDRRRK